MMWEDIEYCSHFWHVRASMDGDEERACNHPESESGVCNEETCPLIDHILECGKCDDWKKITATFGYCAKYFGFRTSEDGCVVEAVK